MKKKLLLLIATFGVAITAASFNYGGSRASATVPGTNNLVTLNVSGTQAANRGGSGGILSADGKHIAFTSGSSDLVSNVTNSQGDVFVRDLSVGTTVLVSLSTAGVQANTGSNLGAISTTGRYVLFYSRATNLVAGTTITTSSSQLYLRDTKTNTTYWLSHDASNNPANANVVGDGVSSDGRFVLFETDATNLGPTITNSGTSNLFMLDRASGTLTILNTKPDGTLPNSAWGPAAAMSCDGSLVVFQGTNAGYTQDPTNHVDVYLIDLRSGKTITNLTYNADHAALYPSISCNGDYVGFSSAATNLDSVVNASQGYWHAFVYDRINNTFSVADQQSGTSGNNNACHYVNFACSQRAVAISDNDIAIFSSQATNLSSTPTSGTTNTYMRNMKTGVTELLSQSSNGNAANQDTSYTPSIDAKGIIAAYDSGATNLVTTTDNNNSYDVFTSLTGY